MAGKHAVNVPFLQGIIFQPGNREMAEQNLVTVGILKIPQKYTCLLYTSDAADEL